MTEEEKAPFFKMKEELERSPGSVVKPPSTGLTAISSHGSEFQKSKNLDCYTPFYFYKKIREDELFKSNLNIQKKKEAGE